MESQRDLRCDLRVRIGLYVSVPSGEDIDTAIRRFALAESAGFATAWTGQRARGAPPG